MISSSSAKALKKTNKCINNNVNTPLNINTDKIHIYERNAINISISSDQTRLHIIFDGLCMQSTDDIQSHKKNGHTKNMSQQVTKKKKKKLIISS